MALDCQVHAAAQHALCGTADRPLLSVIFKDKLDVRSIPAQQWLCSHQLSNATGSLLMIRYVSSPFSHIFKPFFPEWLLCVGDSDVDDCIGMCIYKTIVLFQYVEVNYALLLSTDLPVNTHHRWSSYLIHKCTIIN